MDFTFSYSVLHRLSSVPSKTVHLILLRTSMCACMRVCERTTFHLMFLYVVCVSVCCKVYACIVYTGWICISARMLCHVRAHFQKVIVDCRVQTPIGDEIDLLCLFTWRFIFNQSLSLHQLLFFLPALWRSHIQRNNERL